MNIWQFYVSRDEAAAHYENEIQRPDREEKEEEGIFQVIERLEKKNDALLNRYVTIFKYYFEIFKRELFDFYIIK